MSKTGVIVCGNSGIDYLKHDYDIRLIRSTLLFDDSEYTDFVDIKADEFYQMLSEKPDVTPSTAQTSTGVILETLEAMKNDGYQEVIVITISSNLSGTYEGVRLAANMIEGMKVTVFDSLTLAYAESFMALTAAEMAKNGKSVAEIIDVLVKIRDNQGILISVDTLRYLVKNGRLSGASGFVGSLLKIKPMLHLSRQGKVEAIEKIRTRQKALNRIVEKYTEDHKDENNEVFILHANAGETVEYVRSELLKAIPNLTTVNDYPLTPVVGAHAGPNALAIGWIKKLK